MAHRDLSEWFRARRAHHRQRNPRVRLRELTESAPFAGLFQSKQQVKARAMERALLQEDCECGQMEAGRHVHKPEWVCLADDANEATRLLNVKLEYLQLLHTRRLMIRFDETEEQHDQEIERLTEEINSLFVRADRSLKKITRPFIGGVPSDSPADRLVRLNTQRAIASRVQEISCTFRRRQKDYLQRLQVQKFGSEMFDPEELEAGPTENDQVSCFAKADMAIEMAKFNIQSRDAEIQRIAKSVATLATVFKEVADMVIDQGTLIDRIDYNMDQVATQLRAGVGELQKAEAFQRNTRPERCIFLLVGAIFLCFVILVIKHS